MADYLSKDVMRAIKYAESHYPNCDYPIYDDPHLTPLVEFRKHTRELTEPQKVAKYAAYAQSHHVNSIKEIMDMVRYAKIDGVRVEHILRIVGKSQSWYQKMRDEGN